MGKHKTPRQTISAQCKYGEDDDLIQWYQSIKGVKQDEVKRLLRVALGLPEPKKQSIYQQLTADDIEQLVAQRIEERLQIMMEKVDKTFDDYWNATQREISGAINTLDYRPKGSSQYEPIEEMTVDEETLQMRAINMKKDQW